MKTAHFTFPAGVLAQHLAVLGKTGSGKSHTAKLAIEEVVKEVGARVCILDPIKSDWWGLTSSRDGKQPGLPFRILGGPHGHVPLHASAGRAVADVVASGALPLSIVDMADFEPGGSSRFFVDFAQTLLRKMRGVVYLVLEEAHLFAPKERSGIGQENLAIHWAKTLATAGRSKGIRLVLVTQRTQALHNALLGSCDTVIAHRLTAPADQAPVVSWLKANTSKTVLEQVTSSLSSLKTGEGWLCAGEAKVFTRQVFPPITTYDNARTPSGADQAVEITTAAVDAEQLRALIGEAVDQAKADDPKELRKALADRDKRIRELEARPAVVATPTVEMLTVVDRQLLADLAASLAESRRVATVNTAFDIEDFLSQLRGRLDQFKKDVVDEMQDLATALNATLTDQGFQRILDTLLASQPAAREFGRRFEAAGDTVATGGQPRFTDARNPGTREAGPASAGLEGSQQASSPSCGTTSSSRRPSWRGCLRILRGPSATNILDVIAMLGVRGITPTRETVARWLGIHPNGGRYGSNLAFLRANDYLDGCALTAKGHAAARAMETGLEASKQPLDGSQAQILDVLAAGGRFTRESLAHALGIHPNGGRYGSNLARLRTMGLIPERGDIYLTEGARR